MVDLDLQAKPSKCTKTAADSSTYRSVRRVLGSRQRPCIQSRPAAARTRDWPGTLWSSRVGARNEHRWLTLPPLSVAGIDLLVHRPPRSRTSSFTDLLVSQTSSFTFEAVVTVERSHEYSVAWQADVDGRSRALAPFSSATSYTRRHLCTPSRSANSLCLKLCLRWFRGFLTLFARSGV